MAEQVYHRLCKYDFDVRFDAYTLRSGRDFVAENMLSIDMACKKGTVVALLKDRVLYEGSFVRIELAKALGYDESQSVHSIVPFYLDKGLQERIGKDGLLHKLLSYKSTDLTIYSPEQRVDIVVNEILKKHYRPGTILFYSELFGGKEKNNYDLVESRKLKELYKEITNRKSSFLE